VCLRCVVENIILVWLGFNFVFNGERVLKIDKHLSKLGCIK